MDAGATDAGAADAGATDAGATDAGATDAGDADAGDADAGISPADHPDCFATPDLDSCGDCLAAAEPALWEGYVNTVADTIHCTEACVSDCAAFCAERTAASITDACDTCTRSLPPSVDTAFLDACSANDACENFRFLLGFCPL